MSIPGSKEPGASNISLRVSVFEIPNQHDTVSDESKGGRTRRGDRLSTLHRLWTTPFGLTMPPPGKAVGRFFKAEMLFDVSKGDLEFPASGKHTQNILDRDFGTGAEKSGLFQSSFRI